MANSEEKELFIPAKPANAPTLDVPHAGGRPLKYKTVAEFDRAIKRYFNSCKERTTFRNVWVEKRTSNGKKVLDENGQPEWIKSRRPILIPATAPDITGLAVALDVSRQTLLNYKERPEFLDSIDRALSLCELAAVQGLRSPHARGSIFNLTNNYQGWSDKKVLSGDPNAPLSNPMEALNEKDLRKLAEEQPGGADTTDQA